MRLTGGLLASAILALAACGRGKHDTVPTPTHAQPSSETSRSSTSLASAEPASSTPAAPKNCISAGCPDLFSIACGKSISDNCGNPCGSGLLCASGSSCSDGACVCLSDGTCGTSCKDNCGNSCSGGSCQAWAPTCRKANQTCENAQPCCAGLTCALAYGAPIGTKPVCTIYPTPESPPPPPLNLPTCRDAGEFCGGGFAVCCPGLHCNSNTNGFAVCQ